MTISAAYAPNRDTGNNATLTFAVNFPFGAAADLKVTLFDTLTKSNVSPAPVLNGAGVYDYIVSGTPDASTGIYPNGSVTFNNAPLSNHIVVRERVTPELQQLVLTDNARFPAKAVEGGFDRQEMQLQERTDAVSRALVTPVTDAPLDMTIPPLAARKGQVLGFDAVTGKPSIAVLPDIIAMEAIAAATAASAASVSANLTIIESYGAHKGVNNLFDLINDATIIASIQNRVLLTYLDSYFNAAIALGGTWFLPAGDYHLNATISLAPGVEFWGASPSFDTGAQIYLGGASNAWGMELLNANGTASVEAPKFRDIAFQVTQNGIRMNSATGGFDNTSGTQKYMMRPRFERCNFDMDSGTRRTCLQLNKCFNYVVRDCLFSGFNIDVELNGSDIGAVHHNRSENNHDCPIVATAQGTFGTVLDLRSNDFNVAKNNFVRTSYRKILIENNHFELDGSPGSTGAGGNMPAAIDVTGSNAFQTEIHGNTVDFGGYCDHWLRVAPSTNTYLLSAFNNRTPSNVNSAGSFALTASMPYFNNSAGRCIVRHGGNADSGIGWPMNSQEGYIPAPPGYAMRVTADTPGIGNVGIAGGLLCANGNFVLPYNSDVSKYLEASDWNGAAFLANQLIGTLTIEVVTGGGAAGLVGSWQVLDGGVSVATGTITHTLANALYATTLVASHAFTSNVQIRLWNADGTRNERFYISSIAAKLG